MRKLLPFLALLAFTVLGCGSGSPGDASKPVAPGSATSTPGVAGNTSVAQ